VSVRDCYIIAVLLLHRGKAERYIHSFAGQVFSTKRIILQKLYCLYLHLYLLALVRVLTDWIKYV